MAVSRTPGVNIQDAPIMQEASVLAAAGDPLGSIVPAFIFQRYKNTSNNSLWIAFDTSTANDWSQIGGGSGTIPDGSITNAKLADMAESRIKGRPVASGTGVPVDLTGADVRSIAQVSMDNLIDTNISSIQNGQIMIYNSVSGDWENGSDKRKIALFFYLDGQVSGGSRHGMFINGNNSFSFSGMLSSGIKPISVPFNGTVTKITAHIGELSMNQAPGATNNVTAEFQFHDLGFNSAGSTIGSSFVIPIGADIGNFAGFQQIGPSGQGDGLSATPNVSVLEDQRLALTFETNYSTTQPNGIGDAIFTVIIEED